MSFLMMMLAYMHLASAGTFFTVRFIVRKSTVFSDWKRSAISRALVRARAIKGLQWRGVRNENRTSDAIPAVLALFFKSTVFSD